MAAGSTPPGLRLSGLRAVFPGERPVFDGLDISLSGGSWTCLLGPSGVGKSTLLRLIADLSGDAATSGDVKADDGAPLTGRIAWMSQSDLLLPWASAIDNVTIGIRLRGGKPDSNDTGRARAILSDLGLPDRHDALPAAYSGGMRQRVALARTLFEDRPVVLMDEPFSRLDALTRRRLQDLAVEKLAGRTVLLVTHDPVEALRVADRIIVLTGWPARISEPPVPPTARPRQEEDTGFWQAHRDLLSGLGARDEAA